MSTLLRCPGCHLDTLESEWVSIEAMCHWCAELEKTRAENIAVAKEQHQTEIEHGDPVFTKKTLLSIAVVAWIALVMLLLVFGVGADRYSVASALTALTTGSLLIACTVRSNVPRAKVKDLVAYQSEALEIMHREYVKTREQIDRQEEKLAWQKLHAQQPAEIQELAKRGVFVPAPPPWMLKHLGQSLFIDSEGVPHALPKADFVKRGEERPVWMHL